MNVEEISTKLVERGLKVTPQRIAVLGAVIKLNNHPSAENVIDYIRKNHPNIAVATVYKILDTLAGNDLIRKVMSENGIMRYDGMIENHHHIYCSGSDRITDYRDDELTEMLEQYFREKKISDFIIEDIKVLIIGRYMNNNKPIT